MRIGILTFHYCYNHGAVLQSYALYKYLSVYGKVEFINYKLPLLINRYTVKQNLYKNIHNGSSIKTVASSLLFSITRKLVFERFIENNLRCSNNDNTDCYEHIFIGSDQVWNGTITGGYDNYYWADFECNSTQKIHSYAASCIAGIDLNDKHNVLSKLSRFSNISVREKDVYEKLNSYNIQNTLVLDPVFLLRKEEWKKLTYRKDDHYIYEYNILGVKQCSAVVNKLKDKYNIEKVISMVYSKWKICFSPNKFLTIIRNSTIVVTTSFHGLAFSIIFEIPFVVVKSHTSKDDRLLSLLELIGCADRAISDVSEVDNLTSIDWEYVRKKLNNERNHSVDFITKCISENAD